MSRKFKEVIRAPGLRVELTFISFRHDAFAGAGDAELTDREIMAQGRHKSPKVLPRYVNALCARSQPARANDATAGRKYLQTSEQTTDKSSSLVGKLREVLKNGCNSLKNWSG